MKILKALSGVVGVGAMVAGITFIAPSAAGAAEPTVTVCGNVNYGNCRTFPSTVSNLKNYGFNDVISSIKSTSIRICYFDDINFGGGYITAGAGWQHNDLRNYKYIQNGKVVDGNDKISSFRPC
ncbi:hypothetical protein [Streptomyces cadmiisoli]|uniref:hypothetical protein n=1 Tax=Streptomyces cadmiisoli TaxID=2184053 RepID=UPI003D71F2E9